MAYTHALVVYSLFPNDCGLYPCIGRLVFTLTIVAYTHALFLSFVVSSCVFYLFYWYYSLKAKTVWSLFLRWILMTVPRAQTHRTAQMVDRKNPLYHCQVIIPKAWLWAILGNVLGECHASCTLMTSIVDFEKRRRIAALKNNKFSVPTHTFFSGSQKSLSWLTHPFSHFYIVCIYYFCSCPEYSWNTVR